VALILDSRITDNRAAGGGAGEGVGGGIHVTGGALAFRDAATVIADNSASTSDDDVFGFVFEL
jgi:hypothetical protein